MNALTSAYNTVSSYTQKIPNNVLPQAEASFILSCLSVALLSENFGESVAIGVFAATATMVQGFVSPFFAQDRPLTVSENILRTAIAITGALAATSPPATTFQHALIASRISYCFFEPSPTAKEADSFWFF